jgi:hypothetical protein
LSVAPGIRKLGFRRWHERQLIEAHASLVTAFLCVIAVAVCLDQFRWRDAGAKPLIMLALIVVGVVLGFKTVVFYFKVLFRAEHFAMQAVCDVCKAYGLLEVMAAAPCRSPDLSNAGSDDWLQVRCRKCGHGWTMHEQQSLPAAGNSL